MKISLLIFLLFRLSVVHSQNLLANGGFEDENTCTEYHIRCAPEAWICTAPSYYFYFREVRMAHSGEFFMGIVAGHSIKSYKRTFIRSRLVCGLLKDHRYQLSFFLKSPHSILDSAGVYFTSYDFLFEKNPFHKIVPSIYLADDAVKPVKADTNWQQVVINYSATGEENFLSLGYFGKNDLKGSTGIPLENNFLFFIDDLSMVPLDKDEQLCADWRKNTDSIYAQNERHEYLDMMVRLYRKNPPVLTRYANTILPHIDTLVIPDILFAPASSELNKDSHPVLDSFCMAVSKKSFDSLLVEGHTDSVGTLDYNMKLSADRAQAVAGYLKQKTAIADGKLFIRHYAYYKPVAANNSPEGRRKTGG